MKAEVICRTGPAAGLTKTCGDRARVGRDPANEICIPVEGLSRLHATITFSDGAHWIEDGGSTNGTWLNGRRIRKERLQHLDVISLGMSVDLVFRRRETSDSLAPRTGIVAARLVALDGPEAGAVREIPRGVLTIGRTTACNLHLDSAAVSKMHARLERSTDQLVLIDLDSSNGTFVNGARVSTSLLKDGDRIVIAAVREFRVEIETGTYQGTSLSGFPAVEFPPLVDQTKRQIRSLSESWRVAYDFSPGERAGEVPSPARTLRKTAPTEQPALSHPGKAAEEKVPATPSAPPAPAAQTAPPIPKASISQPAPQAPPAPAIPKASVSQPAPVAPPVPVQPAVPAPPATSREEPPVPGLTKPLATAPIVEMVLRGPERAIRVSIGTHVVGRETAAQISIPDPRMSRHHAVLEVSPEQAVVKDSGSANGTFVNGQRITGPCVLKEGDSLAFGKLPFQVEIIHGPAKTA